GRGEYLRARSQIAQSFALERRSRDAHRLYHLRPTTDLFRHRQLRPTHPRNRRPPLRHDLRDVEAGFPIRDERGAGDGSGVYAWHTGIRAAGWARESGGGGVNGLLFSSTTVTHAGVARWTSRLPRLSSPAPKTS